MAEYMKVALRMAAKVAMAYLSGQLELATMGNGRETKSMEK